MCCVFVVFFFKQKTAYEMRISDWSSDVCSSDLGLHLPLEAGEQDQAAGLGRHRPGAREQGIADRGLSLAPGARWRDAAVGITGVGLVRGAAMVENARWEEHTSELQSLMRISYAVFCLKKKTKENKTSKRV